MRLFRVSREDSGAGSRGDEDGGQAVRGELAAAYAAITARLYSPRGA